MTNPNNSVMPTNTHEKKRELRCNLLARRNALDERLRHEYSAHITTQLLANPLYLASRIVLSYASFGSEFNTRQFNAMTLASGKQLVLPRVDQVANRLVLQRVNNIDTLKTGVMGIAEPDADCDEIALNDIEYALLPGVAFDYHLNRLGYGRGYYDRLLSARSLHPGPYPYLAAAAFSLQCVDLIPVESHDTAVDFLITETNQIERSHDRKNH